MDMNTEKQIQRRISLWNVPADLRAWFERRAQDHMRSLSAQIVAAMIDYKDRAEAMRHGEEE